MRSYFVSGLVWAALVAVGLGQTTEPRTQSVIRPAGYGWRNHVVVPDGPCGCGIPVRADCYDNCCFHCGLRPICLLHRVGRMLDCLLPCNACCGPFGGPLLGGRGCCGTCGPVGCATAAPYSGYGPAYRDPYIDDPLPMPLSPPTPTPSPASEVRHEYSRPLLQSETGSSQPTSPWKITRGASHSAAPSRDLRASLHQPLDSRRNHTTAEDRPAAQSVLRRVSAEEAIPPRLHDIDTTSARPVIRSQSPGSNTAEYGPIPHNPLRK